MTKESLCENTAHYFELKEVFKVVGFGGTK